MEQKKVFAIDWEALKSGTTLYMKDFPSVRLMKLDNRKGCYIMNTNDPKIVDIGEYVSEANGPYHYFRLNSEDWHPLTNRLWIINE